MRWHKILGELLGVTTNTFEVENAAGTIVTYSFNVTITDTTLPTIDCPADFAVTPEEDGTYVIEDYSGLFADNCDTDLDITQEPAAGTVINDGDVQTVTLTATDDAGNTTTCEFVITVDETLGVADVANISFTMYPNPANGEVTISGTGLEGAKVAVFNMLGQKVMEVQSTTLDVSRMSVGTYIVQIQTENASATKRLIVKR